MSSRSSCCQWILAFSCHPSCLSLRCRAPSQSLLDWQTRICVECRHVTNMEQQRVMWLRPDDSPPRALSILFIHWLNREAKVIDVNSSCRAAGMSHKSVLRTNNLVLYISLKVSIRKTELHPYRGWAHLIWLNPFYLQYWTNTTDCRYNLFKSFFFSFRLFLLW